MFAHLREAIVSFCRGWAGIFGGLLVVAAASACRPEGLPPDLMAGTTSVSLALAVSPSITTCEPPLLTCDGLCIDAANDEFNCGLCGVQCAHGLCRGGVCIAPGTGARDSAPIVIRHAHLRGDPHQVDVCDDGTRTTRGTPFFSSSPFGINLPTQTRIHAIVNPPGSAKYLLYAHDASGGAWESLGVPSGAAFGLFTVWGVAGVDLSNPPPASPPSILGQVYVLVADNSGVGGRLAAFTYLADGTSQWEDGAATPPQGQTIVDEPALAATRNEFDGNGGGMIYVAVRTAGITGQAHVSIWAFPPGPTTLESAQVVDLTEHFGGPTLDFNTPLSVDAPRTGAPGFRLAAITDHGALAVFSGSASAGYWTIATPERGILVPTGVQIRTAVTDLHVLASLSIDDAVHPVAWRPGGPFQDLTTTCGAALAGPELGNLFDAHAPYDSASETLYYTDSAHGFLQRCTEPFSASCACSQVGEGQPTDTFSGVRTGYWYDDTAERLYLIGAVGSETTYRYSYDFGPLLGTRPRWTNFLAPRDGFVTLAPAYTGTLFMPNIAGHIEPMMSEWNGHVVGVSANVLGAHQVDYTHDIFESTDDGNCWSTHAGRGSPFPFSGALGDESVGFDSSGRAFVAALLGDSTNDAELFLTSSATPSAWPPASACTPTSIGACYAISAIPSIHRTLLDPAGDRLAFDRPQLVVDRNRVERVFLTYVAGDAPSAAAYFTYCTSGCETGAAPDWCPPIRLPTSNSGAAPPDGSGAASLPTVMPTGQVYLTVQGDDACTSVCNPTPGVRGNYPDAVGVRRVIGAFTRACRASIAPRPDACFCYVANFSAGGAGADPSAIARSADGVNGAAFERSWNFGIEAAGDDDVLAITVRSISDADNPHFGCGPSSRNCRSDLYVAYRERTGRWCGSPGFCSRSPIPTITPSSSDIMLRLNTETDDAGHDVFQRDHTFGAVQPLDGLQFSGAWLDWNNSTDNNDGYEFMSMWYSPMGDTRRAAWSGAGGIAFGTLGGANGSSLGDYHIDANARLHVHHVLPRAEGPIHTDTGNFIAAGLITQTASPMDQPRP